MSVQLRIKNKKKSFHQWFLAGFIITPAWGFFVHKIANFYLDDLPKGGFQRAKELGIEIAIWGPFAVWLVLFFIHRKNKLPKNGG